MELARYDLDTARAMLRCGRYLYVLFCCQQSVEKPLKALIVERTGALPPRIHNLLRLAQVAGIDLPVVEKRFLAALSAYYIQSRYPEEIRAAASAVTCDVATETLGKTEETTQWLFSMRT